MGRVAPLHAGQFLLADNPFRKDVHATCDLILKAELFVQAHALLLDRDQLDVFQMRQLRLLKSVAINNLHQLPN